MLIYLCYHDKGAHEASKPHYTATEVVFLIEHERFPRIVMRSRVKFNSAAANPFKLSYMYLAKCLVR